MYITRECDLYGVGPPLDRKPVSMDYLIRIGYDGAKIEEQLPKAIAGTLLRSVRPEKERKVLSGLWCVGMEYEVGKQGLGARRDNGLL